MLHAFLSLGFSVLLKLAFALVLFQIHCTLHKITRWLSPCFTHKYVNIKLHHVCHLPAIPIITIDVS